jgi:homoserine kinase
VIVSAPGSSANLGPGFDCLGLAVDLPFELTDEPSPGEHWLAAEPTHPAAVAFVHAGGDPTQPLRWRSPIPPGRGLGFSGAARVAGAYLAVRRIGTGHADAVTTALSVAAELEGHADNAAASALGGFTVAAGERALSLAVPDGVELLVWWPESSTSTDASRRVLPDSVPLADTAFSIARAALWVAAIAQGELGMLREASRDHVHQPGRLAARPDSASVLEHLLGDTSVLAAWLSGSGPTVAALVPAVMDTTELVGGLATVGRTRRLAVSPDGVRVPNP